jgi:hypothetical protein
VYIQLKTRESNLYSSPNIIRMNKSRKIRMEHAVSTGTIRNAYKTLIGHSEEKRPLGRSRHRRNNSIKINLTRNKT